MSLEAGNEESSQTESDPAPHQVFRYIHNGETLNLSCRQINAVEAQQLASELANNTTLKHLYLFGCGIPDDGCAAIARTLATNKSLTDLSLYCNGLGDDGMAALGESLKENDSLLTLNLGWNYQFISAVGLTSFADGLKINKGLTKLWLNACRVDDEGAATLADALKRNATLSWLDLGINLIGDEGALSLLNAVAECNVTVTELNLNANNVPEATLVALARIVFANRAGIRQLPPVVMSREAENEESNQTKSDPLSRQGPRYIHDEETLNLSSQGINALQLANELANNTTLKHLYLVDCAIPDAGCVAIARTLATNKSLTDLSLYFNELGDGGMEALGESLKENDSLLILNLGWNQPFVTVVGLTSFADGLKINKGLTKLWLHSCSVDDEGAAVLADALKSNATLSRLDLGMNLIGDEGALSLLNALVECNVTVMELNLNGNNIPEPTLVCLTRIVFANQAGIRHLPPFTSSLEAENEESNQTESDPVSRQGPRYIHDEETLNLSSQGINALQLANELANNTTLKHLYLFDSRIPDDGCAAIARTLATNKSLTDLSLYFNRLGDGGMEALGESLKENDSLSILNLGSNQQFISAVGLASFADGLKINKGLTKLWLNACSVDDEGAATLADALKRNATLSRLDLGMNLIGDEGALSLLNALTECNVTVAELNLDGNNVPDATLADIAQITIANQAGIRLLYAKSVLDLSFRGIDNAKAKQVAKELAGSTTLTTLLLSKNDIADDGSVDIGKALLKNSTLESIEFDDNSISDAGSSAVAQSLCENTVLTRLFFNGNCIGLAGATTLAEMLHVNTSLQELGLGRNSICSEAAVAVAIAVALKRNTTLARLDFGSNRICDVGAMAILDMLADYNCTLVQLNLEGNEEISPTPRKAVDFLMASRLVLNCFLERLHKPLEKRVMPLAIIHALEQNSMHHKKLELIHCRETGAGPIFHLIRAAALNDSKVIKQMK
jgi:Ran GTPase-activating protein (RanGAP) involved in mRNA processing and transport